MTLWIWLVAAIVLVLAGFETYNWFRRRSAPVEVTVPGTEPGADLVRAQMKIAILENRLAQSETLLEEEKEALHAQYRARLARTEAAYQKQMVALRERLRPVDEPEPPAKQEYDVPIADQVEAWLEEAGARLGLSAAPAETATAAELEAPVAETADHVDAVAQEPDPEAWQPAPEDDTPSAAELAAVEAQVRLLDEEVDLSQAGDTADVAGLIWLEEDRSAEQEAGIDAELETPEKDETPGYEAVEEALAALEEMARESSDTPEPGESESALLDDLLMEADSAEEEEPPAGDPHAGETLVDEAAQQQLETIEALVEELAEADAGAEMAAEAQEIAAIQEVIEAVEEADAMAAQDGEGTAAETAVAGDDSGRYEGRWPDLEDQARQRVMVRRLGSELDADYLDDEELLREMGMAPDVSAFGGYEADEREVMMGGNGWVTDPLEEMAKHMAHEADSAGVEVQETGGAAVEPDSDVWEAFVHDQAQANGRKKDGEEPTAAAQAAVEEASDNTPQAAQEQPAEAGQADDAQPEVAEDEEDAMIAATVAAILSRVPDQDVYSREQQEADPAYLPRANGKQQNDANGAGKVPPSREVAAESVRKTAVPESLPVVTTVTLGSPSTGAATATTLAAAPEMVMDSPVFVWEREPITWEAAYFANTKLAEEPSVVRKDKEIDFNWGNRPPAQGVPARTFSVRWSGAMALEPGEYRFAISAPDGVRLWLNDRLMISAWYDQSMQEYHRDIVWNGGTLDVKLEHYENGGDARAFLTWERIA